MSRFADELANILDRYDNSYGQGFARRDAIAALTVLHERDLVEARIDELAKIDQAYLWKSIVTYEGFKKWRDNRLAQLSADNTEGEHEAA